MAQRGSISVMQTLSPVGSHSSDATSARLRRYMRGVASGKTFGADVSWLSQHAMQYVSK